MNFIYRAVLVLLLVGMRSSAAPSAQASLPSEYEVKAVFLYNFAKFIEWPAQAFTNSSESFFIGVIGEDPFAGALEATVKTKSVKGHPFATLKINTLSEIKTCHILFICSSERRRLAEILKAASSASVLTVGETDRFIQAGGMINFVLEGNKVRFEINDEPAKRAGLRINSKLLNLSRHSGGRENK